MKTRRKQSTIVEVLVIAAVLMWTAPATVHGAVINGGQIAGAADESTDEMVSGSKFREPDGSTDKPAPDCKLRESEPNDSSGSYGTGEGSHHVTDGKCEQQTESGGKDAANAGGKDVANAGGKDAAYDSGKDAANAGEKDAANAGGKDTAYNSGKDAVYSDGKIGDDDKNGNTESAGSESSATGISDESAAGAESSATAISDESIAGTESLAADISEESVVGASNSSWVVGKNVTATLVREDNKNVLCFESKGGTLSKEWVSKLGSAAATVNVIRFSDESTVLHLPEDSEKLFCGTGLPGVCKIVLDKTETASVKKMSGMFSGCKSLEELDISGFNMENANSISGFLDGCKGIKVLKTPLANDKSIALPIVMYDEDGNKYSKLPTDKKNITLTNEWKRINISKASIGGVSVSYGYTGKAHTPALKVTVDGKLLTKGVDYKAVYKNNVDPGTADITVTGIGKYCGVKEKHFEIVSCASKIVSGKTYQLVPKNNTKMAVCPVSGKMVKNTKIHITSRADSEAMRFKAIKNSDGTWKLINVKSDMALAVKQNSSDIDAGLVLYDQTTRKAQNWKLSKKSDNSFAIVNAVTGYSAAVSSSKVEKGTSVVMTETKGVGLQRYYLVEAKTVKTPYDGVYSIRASSNTNYSIQVASSSATDGANINLSKFKNENAKIFTVYYSGGGYYRLINTNSGLAVTTKGNSGQSGANIIQSKWAGQNGQRWKIAKNTDGSYTLTNVFGTVLHLVSNKTVSGTNIVAKAAASTKAQKWIFKKTSIVAKESVTVEEKPETEEELENIAIDSQPSDIAGLLGFSADQEVIPLDAAFVTPQMFGARGNGVTDDTTAFKDALSSGMKVVVPRGSYKLSTVLWADDGTVLSDDGTYPEKRLIVSRNLREDSPIERFTGQFNATDSNVRDYRLQGGCYDSKNDRIVLAFCAKYQNVTDDTDLVLTAFRLVNGTCFEPVTNKAGKAMSVVIPGGGHGNSLCYNPKKNKIYSICGNGNSAHQIAVINADTLKFESWLAPVSGCRPWQIAYDILNDIYYIECNDGTGPAFRAYDADFKPMDVRIPFAVKEISEITGLQYGEDKVQSQATIVIDEQLVQVHYSCRKSGSVYANNGIYLTQYNYADGSPKKIYRITSEYMKDEAQCLVNANGRIYMFTDIGKDGYHHISVSQLVFDDRVSGESESPYTDAKVLATAGYYRDLDYVLSIGMYCSGSAATTKIFKNSPTAGGFNLYVIPLMNNSRRAQICIDEYGDVFIRTYIQTQSKWRSWKRLT